MLRPVLVMMLKAAGQDTPECHSAQISLSEIVSSFHLGKGKGLSHISSNPDRIQVQESIECPTALQVKWVCLPREGVLHVCIIHQKFVSGAIEI